MFRISGIVAAAIVGIVPASVTAGEHAEPCSRTRTIAIVGRDVYPESLAVDSAGTVYLGSLNGILYRATPGQDQALPWVRPDPVNGLATIAGVLIDPAGRKLWVCSIANPFERRTNPSEAAIKSLDAMTGQLMMSFKLPAGGTCNDMAAAPDGTLFVTQSASGRIVTLSPVAGTWEVFAEAPTLRGVNGIAFDTDGRLYVTNSITHVFQRVKRSAAGRYVGLSTLRTNRSIRAPDGLRPLAAGRFLIAEAGAGRVDIVAIKGDRATVRPLFSGLMSPTGVGHAGALAYALESKIGSLLGDKQSPSDPNPFSVLTCPIPRL